MNIDLAHLPDDINLLRQMFLDLFAVFQERERELNQRNEENIKLKQQLAQLRRGLFGRSSEKLDPNQLRLAFEALHQQLRDIPSPPPVKEDVVAPPAKKNGHGRKRLPEHLPRETTQMEPAEDDKSCKDCGGTTFEKIGEEVNEQLEYRPASFLVKKIVRPKYACSTCHGSIVVADLPQAVIEKGIPGPGLLAHVITSKYADHLPLNRLEGILARHGVEISRQTMCGWVAHVAGLLEPIYDTMRFEVLKSKVVHADDTPVKVLDPTRNRTKQGRVWVYVGDDDHPHTVYDYQPTRKRDGPMRMLSGFKGYLQGDCWKGFAAMCGPTGAKKAACVAHARRKFFDAQTTDESRALMALQFIRALYDVEIQGRTMTPEERGELRRRESKPIFEQFGQWLRATQTTVLPKSPMGQAIGYTLSHWSDLKRYLEDGAIDIDNNEAERALRSIAIGRRNWTFFGSDEGGNRAATLLSLVNSCKRHGVDPFAYLRDVLDRISTPCPASDLTPARWKTLFAGSVDSPVESSATSSLDDDPPPSEQPNA